MGKHAIFCMFENPRRGRQARNFTTNVPKILDLKSSSEQIFFPKLSLGTPVNNYHCTLLQASFLGSPVGYGSGGGGGVPRRALLLAG